MEQPTSSAVKRKRRASESVELRSLADAEEKEVEDVEEHRRVANLMCDALDLIVESRSSAVAAIRDSHMAGLTAQLQLLVSQFPMHIRKMPMKKFLRQYCPNTTDDARSDGKLHFEVMHDPICRLPTPAELLPFFSSTLASGSRVRARQAKHRRSEASTAQTISPDV